MQQNYEDAMAIVRKYGRPDLFITMTCSPIWTEITDNLGPWQKAHDRLDLDARVFEFERQEAQKALLNDITVNSEFQLHMYM